LGSSGAQSSSQSDFTLSRRAPYIESHASTGSLRGRPRQINVLIAAEGCWYYAFSVVHTRVERQQRMRSRFTSTLFLGLTLLIPLGALAFDAPLLPTLSFYNLNKDRVTLPADLHSDRNLLLLYFQLTQQPDVESWSAAIDHWREADPVIVSYVCLVSPSKNILARWWQNASIRGSSPDKHRWSTTVPLYLNKHSFEQSLGIGSEDQPVLLLLDRQGHVLSRVVGGATEENRGAMRARLQAAGSPPIAPAALPSAHQHQP
jgi:hypothetical protein